MSRHGHIAYSSTSSYNSSTGLSPHGEMCQRLIRMSCEKMVIAQRDKTGTRLHKELMVLHMLRRARDSHVESLKKPLVCITYSNVGDDWRMRLPTPRPSPRPSRRNSVAFTDDENTPPLEWTVRDEEEDADDSKLPPLIFAVEARESDVESDTENDASEGLSPALDEALRRFVATSNNNNEKRKRGSTPMPRSAKKNRPIPPPGALRPLSCTSKPMPSLVNH